MSRLLLLLGAFGLGPLAAWAWFHIGTKPPEVRYAFGVRTNLVGFEFSPIPVSPQAMEQLATTNLFNGQFLAGDHRFTVFSAEWKAETAREMSMLGHTPDVCWVGAGFTVDPSALPPVVTVSFEGVDIGFECRSFRPPGGGPSEVTLWCTLVGGRPLEEGFRFAGVSSTGDGSRESRLPNTRRRGLNMFLRALTERVASDGRKQFVRLSAPMEALDPGRTLESLKEFAARWLELQVDRAPREIVSASM